MGLRDHLSQALNTHVRINLCRREALMAKKLLHRLQVRAAIQQVRGKAVAQPVRRRRIFKADLLAPTLDDVLHRAGGQPPAIWIREEGLSSSRPHAAIGKVLLNGLLARATKNNHPFLGSLAGHDGHSLIKKHVTHVQGDHFGRSQSRPVNQFKNGSITQPLWSPSIERKKLADFALAQHAGQVLMNDGRCNVQTWIHGEGALAHQPACKGTYSGKLARPRLRRAPGLGQPIFDAGLREPFIIGHPLDERTKIRAVGANRRGRAPSLQIGQELLQ